ncbi:hypothetical protein Tco_0217970 [Tanacetum coccineum]
MITRNGTTVTPFEQSQLEEPSHPESQPKVSQHEEPLSTEHQSPTLEASQPKSSKKHKTIGKPKESEPSPDPSNSESSSASLSFKYYDNYMPITERVLAKNLQGFSKVLYDQIVEDSWAKHEEAIASYADLRNTLNTQDDHHATLVSGSSVITLRVDKGKGIASETDHSPPRLVKALRKVCIDPDTPVLIEYMFKGKIIWIPHDQLQAYFDKKVVNDAEVQIAGSKEFLKHQDAHLQVLFKAHSEKLKKTDELRKKSDFGISEWDERSAILPKNSNKCVCEMMTSLSKKYERMKEIPNEVGLNLTLPLPEQDPSLPKRKRKSIDLEPKTYIVGLHCNKHY